MHILLVSFDFCLEAGGIENTSYLLAKHLSKYADVSCYAGNQSREISVDNVTFYKSKYSIDKIKFFSYGVLCELLQIDKVKNIDYVLGIACYMCPNVLLLNLIKKIPFGFLCHGNELMDPPRLSIVKNVFNMIYSKIPRKLVLQMADQVFANSKYTSNLVENIHHRLVHIVHSPIDFNHDVDENMLNADKKKIPLLLSIGRIVERKGFQNVIKALYLLKDKLPSLQYIIGGEGPFEPQLRKLASDYNLNNRVQFLGRVSESAKRELYNRCGLFVMPSMTIQDQTSVEGFGIVSVEANSFGKFVIASETGGVSDAVIDGKTGLLSPEGDIHNLAVSIERYYSSSFSYSSEFCIDWAKKHSITEISKLYFSLISLYIDNRNSLN